MRVSYVEKYADIIISLFTPDYITNNFYIFYVFSKSELKIHYSSLLFIKSINQEYNSNHKMPNFYYGNTITQTATALSLIIHGLFHFLTALPTIKGTHTQCHQKLI